MTIKQQGGIFGRNPTFNDVEVEGTLDVTGNLSTSGSLSLDGAVTINDSAGNNDFRVEGTSTENLLLTDANGNAVRVGGANSTYRVDSGGGNANPRLVSITDSTGTNRTTEPPALTLANVDSAKTANRMSRLSFAAISNNLGLPIHSADITAVYTSGASGNGVTSNLLFSTTNNAIEQSPQTQMTLNENGHLSLHYGNLIVSNGKGIDFSATSGTGTSELFDDYEEGTWTGTYGGNTAEGTYTKIGRAVYVDILLSANSASFSTITGLPYTCAGAGYSGGFSIGRVARMDFLDANGVPCRVSVSGTTISFTTNVATGGDAAFTVTSDASGTVRAGLSGVYYV